jgi:hypothetical protein
MHVQAGGDTGVQPAEKGEEFLVAVPPRAVRQQGAALDVECGIQGGGPVTGLVVDDALGVAEAHRQQRLSAFQGWDLALFVHAEDEPCPAVEVEAHDVLDLLGEERIGRESEAAGAMGRWTPNSRK